MADRVHYERILLKLSGEALGGSGEPFQRSSLIPILDQVEILHGRSVKLAVVVGGGNIYRGRRGEFPRETGDRMGMLATALNGLALREFLEERKISCLLQCAFPLEPWMDAVDAARARDALERGKVVIFCGGTGLPYFSTDTAAALRALDIRADLLAKASTVDGVYDRDPRMDPTAQIFEKISYGEVLRRELAVMDREALCLCQRHRIPVMVFSLAQGEALADMAEGKPVGTLIGDE
jgi:uridylate kinase